MTGRRAACALAATALIATGSVPARAFVRERTRTGGTPIAWPGSCVTVTPDAAGYSGVPPGPDDELAALGRALANWTDRAVTPSGLPSCCLPFANAAAAPPSSCSYLRLLLAPPVSGAGVGPDGVNLVVYRESVWGRPGSPCTTYDPSQVALTTVFYIDQPGDPHDGQILDADTELNAVDYGFSVDGRTTSTRTPVFDVEAILTHELGHTIGLDHTCWNGNGTQPRDDQGNPVPPCVMTGYCSGALPARVTCPVMFYGVTNPPGDEKRFLTTDDIAGACAIYPLARDPNLCTRAFLPPAGGCACDAAPRPSRAPTPVWLLAPLGAIAMAWRRRRAR